MMLLGRQPKLLRAIALVVGLAVPRMVAGQITLYNTFGPGLNWQTGQAYGVDGSFSFAFWFSPQQSGFLSQITVPLGGLNGSPATSQFKLLEGPSTNTLGNLLEAFLVPNIAPLTVPPSGELVTFASALHPFLTAGLGYWLFFAEPGPPDEVYSFIFFNPRNELQGPQFVNGVAPTTGTQPAFLVEGQATALTTTPEPATWSLVAFGLLACLPIACRRHRQSVQRRL